MITVTLVCGCQIVMSDAGVDTPQCETHGERRVLSVQAPPPRFKAVDCEATGPYVTKG